MYVFFKMCVCVCVTYNYHGAARQFQSWAAGDYWWVFLCMLMLRIRRGEKSSMERNTEWSECVFVCMWESRRAGQSEESLLAVPFKSDLVAVSVVTYCRSAVQSLSKSSDLHPHEKTEWTASCHKLKAGISHFNSSQWLQHRLLFQMKIFFFFDYIS